MTPTPRQPSGVDGSASLKLVQRHHQRARLGWLLWSLGGSLLAYASGRSEVTSLWPRASWAEWALAIISILFLFRWFSRGARVTKADSVRVLDRQWALRARLESTWELQGSTGAIAESQRSETEQRVAHRRTPLGAFWFTGLTLVTLGGLMVLAEFCGLLQWRPQLHRPAQPEHRAETASTPSTDSQESANVQKTNALSDLRWISPAKTVRASAIEEVWLKAAASSPRGLALANLEVSVNGGPTRSLAVNADVATTLAQPGEQAVELSLLLDELSVSDYDVVSYFLKAESPDHVAATSPIQFIQIRPANETVSKEKNEGKGDELVARLFAIQTAQLDLLQRNFLLTHANISHRESDWAEANVAVSADQSALARKTQQLRSDSIAQDAPARIVDDLGQAADLMEKAGGLIKKEDNSAGVVAQQRALAVLADCDRLIHKTNNRKNTAASDPFPDQKKLDLPDRAKTAAGQLEALAAQQDQLVDQLAAGTAGGTKAAQTKQAQLAAEMNRLSENKGLSDGSREAARRAAREATSAAQRLAAGDPKSALSPATAASAALHESIDDEQRTARELGVALMEASRRTMNEASRIQDATTRADVLERLAVDLRAGAVNQQEHGSEVSARDLAKLAQQFQGGATALPSSPEWSQLTQQAAAAQLEIAGRADAVNRAVRQLDRGRRELSESGDQNGRANLELAGQMGRELLTAPKEKTSAETLLSALRADVTKVEQKISAERLFATALEVQQALSRLREEGKRDERVRRFNPNSIDPKYRSSVEDYFKALSRGGANK